MIPESSLLSENMPNDRGNGILMSSSKSGFR
jgi:hypothetical protein